MYNIIYNMINNNIHRYKVIHIFHIKFTLNNYFNKFDSQQAVASFSEKIFSIESIFSGLILK